MKDYLPLNDKDFEMILEKARVPEHSVRFMAAMSGGQPFLEGPYLFFHAEDWLLAVGYPIQDPESSYCPDEFDKALIKARRKAKAQACWAICPSLPERIQEFLVDKDQFYTLTVGESVPSKLSRLCEKGAAQLTFETGKEFTSAHRRLWAEFTGRVPLKPNVRELYARTEDVLAKCPSLMLLNAWDQQGNLSACLLLDTGPKDFVSYLLGAHSKEYYLPYASDMLFGEMIKLSAEYNKKYIHLGLGVNEGITRFKTKWGGQPDLSYEMAEWTEPANFTDDLSDMMRSVAQMPHVSMTREQFWDSLPPQRPFTLVWELEKDGRKSWIGGTAHFFCYSFASSLSRLFEKVDTVIFEGPLDQDSLDGVAQTGKSPDQDSPRLIKFMTPDEIKKLDRVVCGPRGFWARMLGTEDPNPADAGYYLADTRHWFAFFSLWTHFLRRHDWKQSVDLEAWHVAHEMGKEVLSMETIKEQLETLESIPVERITDFFRQCGHWKKYINKNMKAYLKGDLDAMMGTSVEFPSRTDTVIDRRDKVFLERMLPHIRNGRCAVFVGSAHMFNLQGMLSQAGFKVTKLKKV
ncbi:TraB/GumN family protein [Desulfonatronovibrio magnus]|uniref:TraB/GumN family protein n=1 Tax=Desulfonatronovibrio magnus TaxID=698827 RepID=UPI000ACE2205|nr:TraB/GumN family protein [Desulfonatronovibrio magnus]